MAKDLATIKRTIARSIEQARTSANLTQIQLAQAVGVNPSTVVRWERQANPIPPGFDTAVLVAEALGVSLDQLAFGEQPFFERVVVESVRRIEQRQSRP